MVNIGIFKGDVLKKISGVLLLCMSTSVCAKTIDYNQNFPRSLLSLYSDYTLIQLPDDKLYLVNEKKNHAGCQKILNKPAYEWQIDARKYVKPVEGADQGISPENVEKLQYILLSDTPLAKKESLEKQVALKHDAGEMYCEALSANLKTNKK